MKSNKKEKIIFFLGICIIFSLGINLYSLFVHIDYDSTSGTFKKIKQPSINAVHYESYIHIRNNWTAAVLEDWCSGDGSFSNPYTIENVIINATNSPINGGILIENNLNDYFKIKNCTIFTSNGADIYGIFLSQSDNGTLIGNDFSHCLDGIRLTISDNCTISENTANYNYHNGINITECKDTTIIGNMINNNDVYGIYVSHLEILYFDPNYNVTIIGNTIEYNHVGLWMDYTYNGEIKHNSINFNNYTGVHIYQSKNLTILNNSISSNGQESYAIGLSIGFSNYCEISMNSVSNNTDDGIFLDYCGYFIVSNNIVDLNDEGIKLITSICNNITDNTVRNNNGTGIELENSNYNRVTGNSLSGNGACIKEEGTSEGNIIENNDCGDGDGGGPQLIIPGFNLYLILGLIGIISVILMKRRCKN